MWGNNIGTNQANCDGCGSKWDKKQTAPVGSFDANAFGLHDMLGNVYELVQDSWHDNYKRAPPDGSAWEVGLMTLVFNPRVMRGGSWDSGPKFVRSSSRLADTFVFRQYDPGFRLARTL